VGRIDLIRSGPHRPLPAIRYPLSVARCSLLVARCSLLVARPPAHPPARSLPSPELVWPAYLDSWIKRSRRWTLSDYPPADNQPPVDLDIARKKLQVNEEAFQVLPVGKTMVVE
jgi:hypothetical protein